MRLPQPDPKTLNPEQRALWDMIAGGPRGGVRGPYFALLHAPKLCAQVEALARFLRFECSIPQRLRELVILVTGRRWNAEYEWFAHEPFAQKHGVSQAVIDAVREWRTPPFEQEDERAVYALAHELAHTGFVSDANYQAVNALLGDQGTVELVGLIGNYTIVAMMLNTFQIGVPEGEKRPFTRS